MSLSQHIYLWSSSFVQAWLITALLLVIVAILGFAAGGAGVPTQLGSGVFLIYETQNVNGGLALIFGRGIILIPTILGLFNAIGISFLRKYQASISVSQ
jgi:hypothetical protein